MVAHHIEEKQLDSRPLVLVLIAAGLYPPGGGWLGKYFSLERDESDQESMSLNLLSSLQNSKGSDKSLLAIIACLSSTV